MTRVRTAAFCGLLALGVFPAGEAVSQQPQSAPAPATAPPAQPRGYTYGSPDGGGSGPAFTFELGKWGSTPSYFPYADSWSQRGKKEDPACNMPSSPCWNEDRQ